MQRQLMIKEWLQDFFSTDEIKLEIASADASFRRYFRTRHKGKSYIVMDAPPKKEFLGPFLHVAELLKDNGINTPEIYAQDLVKGCLLLSDFGSTDYLTVLTAESADKLYQEAIETIVTLQQVPNDGLVDYDDELLHREMNLFTEWYIGRHLNFKLEKDQSDKLESIFALLAETALSQPQVAVHRDFHSRNLMVLEKNNPGVIDFQDAVKGAISYDLVSLLKDSYIAWPPEKVDEWLKYYYDKIKQVDGVADFSFSELKRWFDFMGVQRHLKVAGIFSRLNYRDGKSGYMGNIPQTLSYIHRMSVVYPELAALEEFCLLDEMFI